MRWLRVSIGFSALVVLLFVPFTQSRTDSPIFHASGPNFEIGDNFHYSGTGDNGNSRNYTITGANSTFWFIQEDYVYQNNIEHGNYSVPKTTNSTYYDAYFQYNIPPAPTAWTPMGNWWLWINSSGLAVGTDLVYGAINVSVVGSLMGYSTPAGTFDVWIINSTDGNQTQYFEQTQGLLLWEGSYDPYFSGTLELQSATKYSSADFYSDFSAYLTGSSLSTDSSLSDIPAGEDSTTTTSPGFILSILLVSLVCVGLSRKQRRR